MIAYSLKSKQMRRRKEMIEEQSRASVLAVARMYMRNSFLKHTATLILDQNALHFIYTFIRLFIHFFQVFYTR